MTPFDESTWTTTNESALAPTRTISTDARPQSALGIASLTLGITSWMIVLLFFARVRNPYSGWGILVCTVGAILLGAIGMAPVITGRGVRRGAAIAGLVLGLAVVAGVVVIAGLFFLLLASGGVQFG